MCNCVTIAWYCLVSCIKTFCLLGKIYENDMLPEINKTWIYRNKQPVNITPSRLQITNKQNLPIKN